MLNKEDDRLSVEILVTQLLEIIGEDSKRPGLKDTPHRVAKMYQEVFEGYAQSPDVILDTNFDEGHNEMVVLRDIPFYSMCEHHMVPFHGIAHVGYLPNFGKVVGLSKLIRLVECFAKRLQIQERLTTQIANSLMEHLNPLGAMVVIEAEHLCMSMRGVQKPGTITVTSAIRGAFTEKDNPARQEFLGLIGRS